MRHGPKAIFEKTTMRGGLTAVTRAHLKWGDILIEIGSISRAGDVAVLVGQALASRMRHGSMNARHALILVDNSDAVEATGAGICYASLSALVKNTHYVVYRCRNAELRKAAATHADRMVGGKYSAGKALASPFRLRGRGVSGYITGLKERKKREHRMFCSELVAAAYELAADELQVRGLHVNPRALSVKALDAMLSRSSLFRTLGCFVTDDRGRVPSGTWTTSAAYEPNANAGQTG